MKEEEKEFSKIEAEEVAQKMKVAFSFVMMLRDDMAMLEKSLDQLQKIESQYSAIGFMEGAGYHHKLDAITGKKKRMESLINLIKTLINTDPLIQGADQRKRNQDNMISSLMGI